MRYWLGCLALLSLLSLGASCENENPHDFPDHTLSLDPKNVVVEVGGTQTFTAIYKGVVVDPNDLTWRTDNDVIAGIDSQGVATGFSDGIAEVTATSDHFLGKRGETALGTAIIVVNKGVRRVEVDFVRAVALGGTYPYTATVHGVNLDPADRSVTWSIANTNIATVNSQGVVTGVAEGHTTVTATSDLDRSKSGTMRVRVTRDKFVNNVQVIPDRGTVTVGGKQTFTAIVSGANLDLADKTVTWSTIPIGNPWGFSGVVRVNAQGVVTGVTEGETKVYATSNFAPPGSIGSEGIAEIIVTSNKTVNSVTVTPANASVAIGDTQTFTATVNGINPDPADRTVTWSTADTSIATVNANGVVTGVAEGQTTITATSDFDNTQSGAATIAVTSNKVVSSVVVTPTNASVGIGDTQTLTATVNGINLDPADETVTWSVIDSSIAKVSAQGVVTGIAVGQTKVTATSDFDSTKSGTATIVVTSNKTVSGVTVTPVNASLSVGDTQAFTATVNGANLDPDDRRVTWLVADTSIATVSAQGVLTGVAEGQTTVTAKSDFDNTKSGTATIVVTGTNDPPIANAGSDQSVSFGELVTLDGTASSDPDGDPLTFQWAFASTPAGSNVTLNNANTATPSFTTDADTLGTYELILTVTDNKGASDTDTVAITVVAGTLAWDGGGDGIFWSDPLNWTGDVLPSVDSVVPITSGDDITLDATVTIAGLRLLGGILRGNGQLTVTDATTWTQGTLAGNGTLILQGTTDISGTGRKLIGDSRVIENHGTIRWTGTGAINSASNPTLPVNPAFNNLPLALFQVQNDAAFSVQGLTFENNGTIIKNLSTGVSDWSDITFNNTRDGNNTGLLTVESGTFQLGFGNHNAGFVVAGGATLEFNHDVTLAIESSIVGDILGEGTVEFRNLLSGTNNINGVYRVPTTRILNGRVNFNNGGIIGNLELSGGALAGGINLPGTGLSITDTFTWTGGSVRGDFTLNLEGDSEFSLGSKTIGDSPTVNNTGTITWTSGSISGSGSISPIFNNLADGIFDVQNDLSLNINLEFNNFNGAILRKTVATGTSNWSGVCYVDQGGILDIQAGNITFATSPCS